MKTQFELTGTVRVTAEHSPGDLSSHHVATDFYLEVSENLDESKYINDEDILTKAGSEAITQVFIQGLIGNIHFAHQQKFRDSAEHLRYIISELERGFASVAHPEKSTF